MSVLESFYTRGDKRLNKFIYELYINGAYLESWDENLDIELYNKISKKLGIDIEFEAAKEIDVKDTLPWDNISYGVNKTWLINEYKKAKDAVSTIPCEIKCNNCGVCKNLKTKKVLDK